MIEIEGLDQNRVEKYVEYFCQLLCIDIPKLFIFVDEELQSTGVCYENEPGDYMIVLKDQKEEGQMIVSLAHELVHVKQYIRNGLAKCFDSTIPYMERWWEQEAYEKESVLIKALINHVKNGNN